MSPSRLNKPWVGLIEIAVFYGLAMLIIWGSGKFRPPVLLVAVVMIGICVGSNKFHKDSLERIGLAKKNFLPALKLTALISLPLFIAILLFAWGKPARGGWDFWFSILGYPFWGFAQEYLLYGFMANRLEDFFGEKKWAIAFIIGVLFGSAHIPNPVLTPLTFISGIAFTFIFLKHRHLIPLALAHAAFGVAISFATSGMNGMMSVGPAYIKRVGHWF